ncbi:M48 metallopeptidase family protein [Aquifex aeolicus]|uniref:Uncharacterized protein aq_aa15 n=1 Tax=Aquifex aeolicus (strain VF5) TaxID=224324 RepID=YZ15_AQUAE|nr:M56 family metallopeptidase [Aquifex aeolicus]O66407.1 RecName: Full=Uncharacterized protein aq_aa15 [Aquifex aeolicus VF5]AAC07959.1 unknown protein [Aquifex aeolicus VF5]
MKERVENLLKELKERLGIEREVKIELKRFKRKLAPVSLTKRVIYINRELIPKLSDEELGYLIAHELLHLKHGIYHISEFEKELLELSGKDLYLSLYRKTWKGYNFPILQI